MFNNHTMSVVLDLNMIGPGINNKDFITVAAITTSQYPNLPNIYNASILIPPTEILMRWADGDQLIMQNEYPRYLMTQAPDEMLTAFIAALTQRNIILYIPKDEFMVFGQILLNHIYFMYGIICNFGNTVFSIDQSKLPFIISKFLMIDVMEAKDYLDAYPANQMLPDFVINKLAEQLQPFPYPATFQQYRDYFNKLNASKGFAPKPMVSFIDSNGGKK